MALATFDSLRDLATAPHQRIYVRRNSIAPSHEEQLVSTWALSTWPLGVAPTTAVVPTNATAGALLTNDGGSGRMIVVGGSFVTHNASESAIADSPLMLVDRLSHQGGLAWNLNTSQTTNLPTAALTRYTNGIGVLAAIESYSSGSANLTTITVTYTNQAGTGSRTGAIPVLSSGSMRTNSMIVVPLQAGDTGVKSVESVILSVAKSTAGNFGITLFKPLAMIVPVQQGRLTINEIVGWGEEILDGACLQILPVGPAWHNTFSPDHLVTLDLAEC